MKTNTFTKKVVGGLIALLLVGITLPTPRVEAVTMTELQAQIQSLLVQITNLQQMVAALGVATPTTCPSFPTSLTVGSRGAEVTNLQHFLIEQGHIIPAGATGYFGSQTLWAVQQFQFTQGIIPASGHFGPITRAKAQNLCIITQLPEPPDPDPEPTFTLQGEASIERFTIKDGDDTDLEEGGNNQEVMEISFRVDDGDAKIRRIDLGFTPDPANREDEPWDTFKDISIWHDNELIAEIDGSREKNWDEDSPHNGDYSLRLSGLDWIIEEDDEVDMVVEVSIQNSVKGTTDGEIWTLFIPDNGIRGIDGDNAAIYAGDTPDSVTINLDSEGASDELIIRRSDNDPDSTSLQLDDNGRSGYLEVFAFDIDTDDSRNDIQIRELPIEFTFGTSTADSFWRNVRITAGGETYTRETLIDGITGTALFEFDRDEFVVDAGDRITVMVEIDFNALGSEHEGTTIRGRIAASDITAKGSDTLSDNQLSSAASGETHFLFTKGTAVSSHNLESEVTTTSGPNNDYATFSITIDIDAFNQDVYIPIGPTGVTYQLTDALGSALNASGTAVVTSSARETGNYFWIREGEEETLTLDVTYVPGAPNVTARLQLININFSDTTQTPTQTWQALPTKSYRTPVSIIVN